MANKVLTIPIISISLVFIGVFFMFPTDAFACHESNRLHRDHTSSSNEWNSTDNDANIGKWGPDSGSSAGAYDNIIFNNVAPGRYNVNTHGRYGGQSDEHMVVVASSGDTDTIPDLDGSAGGQSWLWGQGTVDMCDTTNGSITIRAYSQVPNAVCSLTVDEVIIERIGDGGCTPSSSLIAQCSVSPTIAGIGENVTWTATASGGSGIHKYTWSGDVSGTAEKIANTNALDFDGVDDYVEVSNQSYFTQAPFTVAAWVKFDKLPIYSRTRRETFVSKQHTNQFPYKSWFLGGRGSANNKFEFTVVGAEENNIYPQNSINSNASININTWYHVVATLDSNYNMELYIDGVKQADTNNSGSIFNSTGPITIGGELMSFGMTDGIVDEVYFYSRVLSSSEINDLYNYIAISNSNLLGHWKFDEGSGTITSDSSGSGNTGTLMNNPLWVTVGTGETSYSVNTSYSTVGTKIGQITVTSGIDSSTVSCINSVAVGSQCSNTFDDDGDGFADNLDAGCYDTGSYNPGDDDETNILPQCSNFFDDDTDSFVDLDDPDCFNGLIYDPNDNDESTTIPPVYQCSDGINNDFPEDNSIDSADPGCYTGGSYDPNDDDELNGGLPQCANFFDDDGDSFVDLADPGCSGASDALELNIRFEEQ